MSGLSELIQRLVYVYRRDPEAARIALDSPNWIDTHPDDLDEIEQHERMTRAWAKEKRDFEERHFFVPQQEPAMPQSQPAFKSLDEVFEAVKRRPPSDPVALAITHQSAVRPQILLTQYFAENVDSWSSALEAVETKLAPRMPPELKDALKETSLALAMNSFVGLAVLMGAILEWSIRDLLGKPREDEHKVGLSKLINEAKRDGLFKRREQVFIAREVNILRNAAAHQLLVDSDRLHKAHSAFLQLLEEMYWDREI